MASTIHSRPAASSSRQVARNSNLPTYQPLTHKLNPGAEHALRNLPTTHSLNELKRRLQTAVTHLTEVTGDLNDQHQIRKAGHEKQKARQAARDSSQGSGNTLNDEADRRMEDASREADDWTGKMERGTRNVIDIQARVEDGETALREMNANISQQGRGTATQSTLGASQHRPRQQQQQQRRARNDDDDDGVGDSSNENEEEEGAHTGPSPLTAFKTALTASSTAYASLSLQDRYAAHNDYIGFRKILHDALHPNDDTPLPHASTWFPTSPPQTTTTNPNRRRGATSPSPSASSSSADDDIQIAREKRSIRCPITLLPMHDPLTSTLCPHSFERSAILSMLDSSAQTARGGQKAMNCPECEVLLTAGQLKTDAVLVRKIRRIEAQERREREGEGSEDEDEEDEGDVRGTGGRRRRTAAEEVGSSPVRERKEGMEAGMKEERMSGRERETSMVPATQIVDFEDESGEEME